MVSQYSTIKKDNNDEGMFHFINKTMAKNNCVLFDSTPPRIFLELRFKLLQLSLDTSIGVWHIFENHTILRVYGFEEEPYMLPIFLTPRIYALEYIRKRFEYDHKHFVVNNHPITFRLHHNVGPFVVRIKTTKLIVEDLLRYLNFQQAEKINYDPHHVISERRKKNKAFAYVHQLQIHWMVCIKIFKT
jgi:hypothetical protein